VAGPTVELNVANISNLAQAEVRILGLRIDDELTHRHRQGTMVILPLFCGRTKQARYAERIKGFGGSPQRAFR